VYLDRHKAVMYSTSVNPSLGRSLEVLDPLEWLARMSDHIPEPDQRRTLVYGHSANRTGGARQYDEIRPRALRP
jgi:hypothetical protein